MAFPPAGTDENRKFEQLVTLQPILKLSLSRNPTNKLKKLEKLEKLLIGLFLEILVQLNYMIRGFSYFMNQRKMEKTLSNG